MTDKKQSKLGFDPLAWMNEEEDSIMPSAPKEKLAHGSKQSVSATTHPLGLNVPVLQKSFNLLAPKVEELVADFYAELFARHPGVIPLFKNTDDKKQQQKLIGALKLVINNLNKVDNLAAALQGLGQKHQGYGAEPDHYQAVATVLLDVMKKYAGRAWTSEVKEAWTHALNVIASTMLGAYAESEDTTMAANAETMIGMSDEDHMELVRMRSAVDGAMTAIMMIDRDFKITYANRATIDMLTKHQDTLRSVFPGFNVSNLIGGCVDQFHKNPAHQRQLLNNPGNLPYSTDITVGPLRFRLNVSAMVDGSGNYIGNTLEWSDVTELRQRESEVVRLQGTVDNAMTSIMMIDRDLVITYANKSTVDLLNKHGATLRSLYPTLDLNKLVGTCIDVFHANPAHQRQLLSNPANLPYSTDIKVGPLVFRINVTAIRDNAGTYVGNALEWSDVTETRAKELEVARLQSAVNGAQTNIMLCDDDLTITYVNPAVVDMLVKREGELRQRWPSFNVKNLVGQSIDQFHKNPAHQRGLLKDASRLPAKAEIKVGDLEFEVNATMIKGPKGEYMGNMVEWRDITEQKDAERQIRNLIISATQGELDSRISAENYDGFMRGLADGINSLMEAIVEPLRESKQVLRSLADGDLTKSMEGQFSGEFAELRDAINESVTNLYRMVNEIRDSSSSISSAASEISQGNADLSQRTEEQASSLEETASSMEEMTGTVKQNADNARQANQLASAAREQAEKGGDVVKRAVGAMSEINTSSKKIADIISVIDEIAFQTNLLALNAAVEAARAGEQGRGFAVVAGEVRNLAQRSAGAAKEIKSLINDSVTKVDEGTKLVDESGATLDEIVNAVKKVSDIIAEIAAAGQEQSSGIEQVNKAVMQMDEMTQQNAALVEEAASASESMEEQSKGLLQLMDFFHIGDTENQQQKPAPRRSAVQPPQARPAAARKPAPPVRKPATKPPISNQKDSDWDEF